MIFKESSSNVLLGHKDFFFISAVHFREEKEKDEENLTTSFMFYHIHHQAFTVRFSFELPPRL